MEQMGIAEAEDYLALVLAAYDLASTEATNLLLLSREFSFPRG